MPVAVMAEGAALVGDEHSAAGEFLFDGFEGAVPSIGWAGCFC